jgi:multicomponent Na+:H+ antiporter subunit D
MPVLSMLPGLALLPAALAIPLIVLARRRPVLREGWSVLAAVAQTAVVALMLPPVLAGAAPTWRPLELAPGIFLELRADALGTLFALVASVLWVATTVYSIGYTRAENEQRLTRYFASFALCLFSTVGIAFAGNLLTFYVFFEILTVAGYPLVIHRQTADARRAGRVYLLYTLAGGVALLAAVAWTYSLAGTTDFVAGGIGALAGISAPVLWGLFVLFFLGCGVKAAVVPLHTWLPVAMVAPTPVSALLHAVAVVKAGVFGFARVTGFVFGPELLRDIGAGTVLVWLAAATIVMASVGALVQDNLKRLLAFSTIGQLSYVVLGVALGTPAAFAGGVMHLASHAILKITLFFCAGAIAATAHVDRVSQLTGLGRRMPLTLGAFAAAAFMLAGLPPGVAFVSKWRLLTGALDAGSWVGAGALLASAVLNIGYFAPIVVRAFAPVPPGTGRDVHEAAPAMLVPLLCTATAGLALGLLPDAWPGLLSLASATATAVTGAR